MEIFRNNSKVTSSEKIFSKCTHCIRHGSKVANILKGGLGLIPSTLPFLKIQILGRKNCLMYQGKTLGIVNQLFKTKSFVDITQQCFALLPQVKFPTNKASVYYSHVFAKKGQIL